MNDTQTPTETTPFWRFSLHFYRHHGVSDACIGLQDEQGVDVNLLLFLFWLADDGRQLSADEVKKLDDAVRDWRNLTIVPIRDTRRKLKGARTIVDPSAQEVFRNKVKAVELDAERLQQAALFAFSRGGPLGRAAEPAAAARGNIAAYERIIGARFAKNAVDVLLAAFDAIEHGAFAAAPVAAGRE
jgi:uncharacterized protein (TIGR02444 family)